MSILTDHPAHLDVDEFLNLHHDSDSSIVDPQLSMLHFAHLNEKAPEQLHIDPSIWQSSFDAFGSPAEQFDTYLQSQDEDQPDLVPNDITESITTSSTPSTTAPVINTSLLGTKASRTSSKSSIPSLSSGSSSPGKRTRSRASVKQDKDEPKKKEAKTSRAKPRAKKEVVVEEQHNEDLVADDNELNLDGSKRNKYLERNRIAASKCRQKKKAWVSDLEIQKGELEAMHSNLQRQYSALVNEVTQLKNDLMLHANCGDPTIDEWIGTEARRFVQRTTDRDEQSRRRMSISTSAGRPSSQDDMMQPSPTPIPGGLPNSPKIKQEDMNYDHMPDDMFN